MFEFIRERMTLSFLRTTAKIQGLFGFEIINNYQFSSPMHFVHFLNCRTKVVSHQMLTIEVRSSKFVLLRMKWVNVYAAKKLKSSPPTEEIRELANFSLCEIVGEKLEKNYWNECENSMQTWKLVRIKLTFSCSPFPFDWCNLCLLRTFYMY